MKGQITSVPKYTAQQRTEIKNKARKTFIGLLKDWQARVGRLSKPEPTN